MYSFYYSTEHNPTEQQIYPVYGDDFGIKHTNQDDVVYKKKEIAGALSVVDADFYLVLSNDLDTKIFIRIVGNNINQQAYFHLRGCKIDYDNEIAEVSLVIEDHYFDVERKMDTPVNWLDFVSNHSPQDIPLHPIVQVYIAGEPEITIVTKGGFWTQPVKTPSALDSTLRGAMHFGQPDVLLHARTTSQALESQNSYLFGDMPANDAFAETMSLCGRYKLWVDIEVVGGNPQEAYAQYVITDTQTNERMFESFQVYYSEVNIVNMPLYSATHGMISFHRFRVYSRIVTAVTDNTFWNNIPPEDILERGIYRYAKPISGGVVFSAQHYTPETPSEHPLYHHVLFGVIPHLASLPMTPPVHPNPNMQYVIPDVNYVPVNPNRWHGVHIWYNMPGSVVSMVEDANLVHRHTIYHTYTFEAMIKALLNGLGLDLAYDEEDDSQFLREMVVDVTEHINVLPAGNLITWNYTSPTTIHEITLGQVLENIKKVFNAHWHIHNGRLKIEHAKWYYKGGMYHGDADVKQDLTVTYDMRGLKRLADGLNRVQFEEVDIPDMFRFVFLSGSSDMFRGYDIIYNTRRHNIKEVEIEMFNTDVVYCMLNPSRIDPKAMYLLSSGRIHTQDDKWNSLEYSTFSIVNDENSSVQYTLLNGKLSLLYLLDRFHNANVLKFPVYINTIKREEQTLEVLKKRTMLQEVEFPVDGVIEWLKLYKTDMGDGQIHEVTHYLHTDHAQALLKHYPELPDII